MLLYVSILFFSSTLEISHYYVSKPFADGENEAEAGPLDLRNLWRAEARISSDCTHTEDTIMGPQTDAATLRS